MNKLKSTIYSSIVPKLLFFALLVAVVAIGLLHLFTPGDLHFYHNIYRRLSYFPIVLGGLWFGVAGGLGLAVLSSIAFIPHVLLYVGHGSQAVSELMEIILYLAAGLLVGVISGRQTRLRERYQQLSEKLQASYARLHEETAQLIEAETRLAAAQKFSALGRLSASLAHEIKNPLASIKGTAEILRDEFRAQRISGEKYPIRDLSRFRRYMYAHPILPLRSLFMVEYYTILMGNMQAWGSGALPDGMPEQGERIESL